MALKVFLRRMSLSHRPDDHTGALEMASGTVASEGGEGGDTLVVAWLREVEHKAASRSALERASELEQAADAHAIGRLVGQAHHQRNVTRPLLALGQVGSLTQVGQRLLRPAARALHVGPIERTCILERLVERGLLARQLQHSLRYQ